MGNNFGLYGRQTISYGRQIHLSSSPKRSPMMSSPINAHQKPLYNPHQKPPYKIAIQNAIQNRHTESSPKSGTKICHIDSLPKIAHQRPLVQVLNEEATNGHHDQKLGGTSLVYILQVENKVQVRRIRLSGTRPHSNMNISISDR